MGHLIVKYKKMIVVRETFIANPGMASKLAKVMKEASSIMDKKSRVMTDYVGEFNKVVLETEYESLGEFEERMKEYASNPDVKNKMAGYTDMFHSGSREIYRLQ